MSAPGDSDDGMDSSPTVRSRAKPEMRRAIRRTLDGMDEARRLAGSADICRRLLELPELQAARSVMVYLASPQEPDLSLWIGSALLGSTVVSAPRVDWGASAMSPARIDPGASPPSWGATPGRHGILQPPDDASRIHIDRLDAVLAPGLAFDRSGARLGRGGGFYDRFLADPRLRAIRIGVCFEPQLVEAVPRDAHDAVMDLVVTPAGVHRRPVL
jgi:5-formyltetrahydrofolate cyclo-ligase